MPNPRTLLLTNEPTPGAAIGQINGYELLVQSGEIESCRAVSVKESFDSTPAFDRVLDAVKRNDYDIIVIWTPGLFPSNEVQFAEIIEAIKGRPILYWEGDPWGKVGDKKPVTKQMSWWMSHSKTVFSTAKQPHFSIFKGLGASSVMHIPHTYCHIKFATEEKNPPTLNDSDEQVDFSIIASNTARIPGLTGSPGAIRRWELVTRLRLDAAYSHRIYGSNWPKNWSEGKIAYESQGQVIRRSKVNLNWDNFDKYEDYSSDRLPIALLAGRPHVTTKHPGMLWLPGEAIGIFQEKFPKSVLNRGKELLEIDPQIRLKLGLEAHNWVKFRLSHRESARYIMSSYYEHIKKPPADPWGELPSL